jgi:hypothetical protein
VNFHVLDVGFDVRVATEWTDVESKGSKTTANKLSVVSSSSNNMQVPESELSRVTFSGNGVLLPATNLETGDNTKTKHESDIAATRGPSSQKSDVAAAPVHNQLANAGQEHYDFNECSSNSTEANDIWSEPETSAPSTSTAPMSI